MGHGMSVHLAIRDAATEPKGGIATVVFASWVGTIVEWYDFFIYGIAAALVFNTPFFPNIDPLAGTLASLATFSVGFIARPIGGAIFGHFGDRLGRNHADDHNGDHGVGNIRRWVPANLPADRSLGPNSSINRYISK
jgi:hypothetical protein